MSTLRPWDLHKGFYFSVVADVQRHLLTPIELKFFKIYNVIVIGTLLSDQIPILLSSAHWWC